MESGKTESDRVPRPYTNVKEYNRIKIRLRIIDTLLGLAFLSIIIWSGLSRDIYGNTSVFTASPYGRFIIFIAMLGSILGVIGLPMDFFGNYVLEHRYNLSNQTIPKWAWEKLKSLMVGIFLGIPMGIVFYYFLRFSSDSWWIYFGIFIFLFSILLARIAPIILFPLFYRFIPLENPALADILKDLIAKFEIGIKGIFTFDMSKNTRKANAGFTGIGNSKRIILSDTLLSNFSNEEIRLIFAHELGHYEKRHIAKNILIGGILLFTSLFLCNLAYTNSLNHLGYVYVYEVPALPLLLLFLSIFGAITLPMTNAVSRSFEREADIFALENTRDPDSFTSAMNKLAHLNLADPEPHPMVEFFLYSHPSIKKRISMADDWAKMNRVTKENLQGSPNSP